MTEEKISAEIVKEQKQKRRLPMSDQDHFSGSWVGYGAALWALIFAAFHVAF